VFCCLLHELLREGVKPPTLLV
ncbi:nuclear pore complex interacting protein family, member A9, partial [Daubentonia madagascariensis]